MERTKSNTNKCVLSFDPSLTAFGWAVICNNQPIDFGCIKTEPSGKMLRIRKGDDRVRRISEISQRIKEVIQKYKIVLIVSEQPHGSQSAVAATSLGLVTGAVQAISDFTNIPIEWFNEADCKKNLLHKAAASKKETINAINALYTVKWTGVGYKDEAIADSIAVYHVARKKSPIVQYLCL